ncbi:MAG: hypothetical protein B6D61_06465 [Bacteroidetes bacterium 4484_249]|nr:MAG: hypothetical protein B6D61_06465 [Bacteroidetes bacterium 4484_249]
MKVNYKIEMLSDWHIGSGLDSGADADALVLKDENNLPFIPGKTIKGLFKDALNEIADVQSDIVKEEDIFHVFGGKKNDTSTEKGNAYFANAVLPEKEKKEIISNELSRQLYRNIASTRIDKKGVAVKNSLRTIEVCIPVVLEGEIIVQREEDVELLKKAFKWTRHIGVGRNRGLGRCHIDYINTEN